ncbi:MULTISPECIES: cupin domain-containing protein [unclassified Helicobacter]|uniref:cupin domain-containing protein n=1 Tax=unclassified Helicobacter TaxID=2593540 RepID=UPI001F3C0DD4|nr:MULTISPECIES: cupin domain-containing protein [unclassified Helicobacter]
MKISKLSGAKLGACAASALLASNVALASDTASTAMQRVIKQEQMKVMKGDSAIFSGDVKVTLLFGESENRNAGGGLVEFSPKARSAWHTHPAGQTLIVVEGEIYTGTEDGITQIAKKGEVIECPANVKHWHGAGEKQKGAHIALTGSKEGKNVIWLEKLSDAEYQKAIKSAK